MWLIAGAHRPLSTRFTFRQIPHAQTSACPSEHVKTWQCNHALCFLIRLSSFSAISHCFNFSPKRQRRNHTHSPFHLYVSISLSSRVFGLMNGVRVKVGGGGGGGFLPLSNSSPVLTEADGIWRFDHRTLRDLISMDQICEMGWNWRLFC